MTPHPLPPISRPPTATSLRDRVLAQMNGESRELSRPDRERRRQVLERLDEQAAAAIRRSWREPPDWPGRWGKA